MLDGMRDGAWLDAQVFPPLQFAVPGIIPEGLVLLVGPPKLGKSFLVADVGLACAAGGLALGRIRVGELPVLYLALEDGQRRLQDRFRRIMAGQPIPRNMHVITKATTPLVIPMIDEFLTRHRDQRPLIILDTLGRVKPPKRPGDDGYTVDYQIGGQLKAAIDIAPGASLVVVHHSRKAEAADFVDAVSGTHGIAGSADSVLVLRRKRHSNEATLLVTGRDVPEGEYALRADQGMLWRLDGTDLDDAQQTARQRREKAHLGDRALEVLAFVNGRTETKRADVANKFDMDPKRASEALARLADAERIRKVGRGVYAPISNADSADNADYAGQNVIPFLRTNADSADFDREADTESALSAPTNEPGADSKTPSEQGNPQSPHRPHPVADTEPGSERDQSIGAAANLIAETIGGRIIDSQQTTQEET
ncbi:AAA family ATPase [Mycobacterium canetti]|nr:AAA family ATPase [Mycobacterium canetti]